VLPFLGEVNFLYLLHMLNTALASVARVRFHAFLYSGPRETPAHCLMLLMFTTNVQFKSSVSFEHFSANYLN